MQSTSKIVKMEKQRQKFKKVVDRSAKADKLADRKLQRKVKHQQRYA